MKLLLAIGMLLAALTAAIVASPVSAHAPNSDGEHTTTADDGGVCGQADHHLQGGHPVKTPANPDATPPVVEELYTEICEYLTDTLNNSGYRGADGNGTINIHLLQPVSDAIHGFTFDLSGKHSDELKSKLRTLLAKEAEVASLPPVPVVQDALYGEWAADRASDAGAWCAAEGRLVRLGIDFTQCAERFMRNVYGDPAAEPGTETGSDES